MAPLHVATLTVQRELYEMADNECSLHERRANTAQRQLKKRDVNAEQSSLLLTLVSTRGWRATPSIVSTYTQL